MGDLYCSIYLLRGCCSFSGHGDLALLGVSINKMYVHISLQNFLSKSYPERIFLLLIFMYLISYCIVSEIMEIFLS